MPGFHSKDMPRQKLLLPRISLLSQRKVSGEKLLPPLLLLRWLSLRHGVKKVIPGYLWWLVVQRLKCRNPAVVLSDQVFQLKIFFSIYRHDGNFLNQTTLKSDILSMNSRRSY